MTWFCRTRSVREAGSEAREWVADERDLAADARDVIGDARDVIGDERDTAADNREAAAGDRDAATDARQARLNVWEKQLEERARRLGLANEATAAVTDQAETEGALTVAEGKRTSGAREREAAALARDDATQRRLAQRRDTILAAAFAGIAEHLYEAGTSEELLARIAEAALTTVAGSTRATVTWGEPESDQTTASTDHSSALDAHDESVLSFAFTTPPKGDAETGTASLNIFSSDPAALDQAAQDIGFILAAHASLAVRAVGERVRLESLGEQLEAALLSRDVIGQAKGILMERLKTTPEDAFEILKQSSQRLNTKLREVARTLTETGEVDPGTIPRPAKKPAEPTGQEAGPPPGPAA